MGAAREIEPRLLTLEQAAQLLNVPMKEVQRLNCGRIMIGARVRYDRVALNQYLDERLGLAAHSKVSDLNDLDAALAAFAPRVAHDSRRA